jgi:putative DNA primase/helicase
MLPDTIEIDEDFIVCRTSGTDVVFPDMHGKRPTSTVDNLQALLNHYGITIGYNVISKKIVTKGLNTLGDLSEEASLQMICSLASKHNLTESVTNKIPIIASSNSFNPVLDYFQSKKWDGVSRLTDFYNTVTVAANEIDYRNKALRMWMIQCAAAADGAETTPNTEAIGKFESILAFQGGQGVNKTLWFRSLVDRLLSDYLLDGASLNPSNKDSVLSVIAHWLVELGELDATIRKSDIAELKAFLSKVADILRLPYGRRDCTFKRRTSMFASVNPTGFLVDPTGSRRIVPLRILAATPLPSTLNRQQLWAEFYHYYLAGEQWWPTIELALEIAQYSNEHQMLSPIDEAIASLYDLTQTRHGTDIKALSCTQILKAIGRDNPTKPERNEVAELLRKYGFKSVAMSGYSGYRLVEHDSQATHMTNTQSYAEAYKKLSS